MVERSLKHSVLVLTLVFTAFFLFETLAGLRLHAVHYGLVGAALCLFYLALLALGEVLERSEEHTSELQSPDHLVFRLLLEKKKSYLSIPVTNSTGTSSSAFY